MNQSDENISHEAAPTVSLTGFLILAGVSGLTIGLANILTQLFAIHIGASAFEIGVIGSMESLGVMLLTIPAGFIIAQHGSRVVYAVASLGPCLLYFIMPFVSQWWAIALLRLVIGFCIPFRSVSMTSAFLSQLKQIGQSRAGWYRASLILGMSVLGPALAGALTGKVSFMISFGLVGALFGGMAAFSMSFFPEKSETDQKAESGGFFQQLKSLLSNRQVAESCTIEFLAGASTYLFVTFAILIALSMDGLTANHGISVLLVNGMTTVMVLFIGARVFNSMTRHTAYGLALGFGLIAMMTSYMATGFWGLMIAGILLSLGSAMVHFVNVILLADLPLDKSKVSGVFQLSQMLGAAAGSFLGGLMSKAMPLQSIYLAWIPVLLLAGVIVYRSHKSTQVE